jgi:hypothetical protein
MPSLNPLEPESTYPLTVPHAFRAWSRWTNALGVGCLQVPHVARVYEGKTDADSRCKMMDALCEVYSRSVFEVTIGLEYDRVDSLADVHVLQQIAETWSLQTAEIVHHSVRLAGPVARDVRAALSIPQPVAQTLPLRAEAGRE